MRPAGAPSVDPSAVHPVAPAPSLRQPTIDRLFLLGVPAILLLAWAEVLAALAGAALLLLPSAAPAPGQIAGQGAALGGGLTLVGIAPYALRALMAHPRSRGLIGRWLGTISGS